MILFNTPINSVIIIIITIAYFITSAITTFEIRMIQARRDGRLQPDEEMFPSWTNYIFWLDFVLLAILIFLNWRYAILVFVIRFILKVLPILEIIGNILMSPFKPKK